MSITAPAAPAQPPPPGGGGTYNAQLHPRGRGGKWITTKGDGYGAGGANPTTQQLQQRLQQLGFHVPADGKFGPQTEMAVKAFQARYGLDTSGGVDPATMALLQDPPPQTLAQVQAGQKATRAAASAAARKTATAKAKAKAAARTAQVRASAQAGGARRSAALTRTPGVIPGTSTTVPGVGHLGSGMLTQGTGMTGSSNPAVSNLQAALIRAGFTLTKDGRFGPQTEAAVKQLQTKYGLAADGIVGPATKALLLGLASSTRAAAATAATSRTKKIAGQPAVLRTQAPHPRHSSRTAGSRMQLKPPKPTPAVLKYSASNLRDPDLEETTVAFGVGGQPSHSIKDARDNEPTPLVDQPVWDRLQKIANPPSYVIQDGRNADSLYTPPATPSADETIDDGRSADQIQVALNEAIAARQAATDGRTFARALARERILRARLQEAGVYELKPGETRFRPKPSGIEHEFGSGRRLDAYSEAKHPRGRGGKWIDVLHSLKGLEVNKPGEIYPGVTGMRLSTGHYVAASEEGGLHVHHEDPGHVARAVQSHLARQNALRITQEERRQRGEQAVANLSVAAAQHFTRDWSLRGDPEGLPERHEMYSQVHSEDPKGYVKSVFSQQMTPEMHGEAEVALANARDRAHRDKIAPYFDLDKPHELIHVDRLRPTKIDPESSYQNATKRMGQAARGEIDKRKPLTGQVGGDGRLLLVDGNATLEAAKRAGITHVPVEIRPRASNLDPNTSKEAIREQTRLDRAAIEVEKERRKR